MVLLCTFAAGRSHGQTTVASSSTLNPNAMSKIMLRGTGGNNALESFVVPVSFESGVPLDASGNNSDKYPGATTLPWFTQIQTTPREHYDAYLVSQSPGSAAYTIYLTNPVAGFGQEAGGSALYVGQSYSFGAYAGGRLVGDTSSYPPSLVSDLQHNVIRISAYRKTDFAGGATNVAPYAQVVVSLPRADIVADAAAWQAFAQAGFVTTVQVADLTTTVKDLDGDNSTRADLYGTDTIAPWDTDSRVPGPFLMTHQASSADYYYVVEARGFFLNGNVMQPSVVTYPEDFAPDYSPLYSLDFSPAAPWRATLLTSPHFDSELMPPTYQGKSLQELTAVKTPVTTPVSLDPQDCLGVDNSPELRRHPVLDQLVSDLGNDPVALTNFVLNEIELTDAMALNDRASYDQSFHAGGVNRGALDVYLEGQGSPTEQCALLVYLLREAGVPAAYMFPSHDGIKVLDSEMSSLLHFQISGADDPSGDPAASSPPTLVPVNYPWVAAYVNGQWVHLFPWLKDTQITEGLDLSDYLPPGYNNALIWSRAYVHNDPAILSLGNANDPPSVLFPKFLDQTLQTNHPGVTSDDIGMKIEDRRHYYTQWSDFPTPFSVDNNGSARVNLSVDPMIFDVVDVDVYSTANPTKKISTGNMRMADILHRRLIIRHVKTGTNLHNLILSLSNYRPDASATASFGYSDNTWLDKQVLTLPLDATDDDITIEMKYQRQRQVPESLNVYPYNYLLNFYGQEFDDTRFISKGDTAAICFDVGRVTPRMINLQTQDFMNLEAQLQANSAAPVDPDLQQGVPAVLLGLSYDRRLDDFRASSERLNKVKTLGTYNHGLSTLRAQRVGGVLPNSGDINLVQPGLDMFDSELASVGNDTVHPDSNLPQGIGAQDFFTWLIVNGSAEEHAAINEFYQQTDAVSTVRLLQITQARNTANASNPGIVDLYSTNYSAQGQTTYNGVELENADTDIWSVVNATFTGSTASSAVAWMTPGVVQNDSASYSGVGAMIIDIAGGDAAALISPNQNGGYGQYFSSNYFSPTLAAALNLTFDANGYPIFGTFGTGSPSLLPGQFAAFQFQEADNAVSSGTDTPSSFDNQHFVDLAAKYNYNLTGNVSQDQAALLALAQNRSDLGQSGDTTGWGQAVLDPVNPTTGEFHVDAVDLRLNGRFPMELRRNYLSQCYSNMEYGYQWRANYMPALVPDLTGMTISAAEPDGSVLIYRQTTGSSNLWVPTVADNPQLSNLSHGAAGGLHNRFNSTIRKSTDPNSGQVTYVLNGVDGSVRTFTVMSFPGYGLDRTRPYITRWQDNCGNYFLFNYGQILTNADYGRVNRVVGNDGNYLGFYYDPYGHIVEAYTGDGRHVYYGYDAFGDLTSVTLPDGSEIQYTYEHGTQLVSGQNLPYSDHRIIQETKPEGNILENVYDAQGRVTQQSACVDPSQPGKPVRNATFAYAPTSAPGAPAAGYTTVTDVYNKVTRYDYADGQIIKVTDPLNQVVTSDWYLATDTTPGAYPRSLKRYVDKRGLATAYQYDAFGNVTQTTVTGDLTGDGVSDTAVSTSTYSAQNLITQSTDPVGHQQRYYYENATYPYLPTRIEHWAAGTLVSTTLREYTQSSGGSYSSFGLLWREHLASGSADEAITEQDYDGQGRLASRTRYTGTADPAVSFTYSSNLRGEIVKQTDAVGGVTNFSYDGLGRLMGQEVHDETGALVSWNYAYFDGNGQPTWLDGPRYGPEDYIWNKYDTAGRPQEVDRWRSQARADGQGVEAPTGDNLLSSTFYQHDLFGNLVQTTDPRHNVTQADYDAIGQQTATRHYAGDAVTGTLVASAAFTYEPGGQIATATSVLNGATHYYYTAGGQLRRQENADGTVQQWLYNLDGRLQREIFSNGTYRDTTYDDVGRTTTHTLYQAGGGQVFATTGEGYDRRGNMIQRTEAEGAVFTTTFDGLNRVKTATGPAATANSAQQTTTRTYDAAGRLLKVVDALGEETDTTFDVLGRTTQVAVRNSSGITVSSVSYAYSPDHQSVTATAGIGSTALRTTTYTNNDGATVLVRHEDSGQFTRMDYDVAGELVSSADELGRTTAYAYDSLNHLDLQILPDGSQTTFVNDAAGNLLQRQMPGGTVWKATYDTAGRQLTEELDAPGGTPATRQYGYAYYASGPNVGKLQTTTAPGVSHVTAYDNFLRVASVTSTGSLPTQSLQRQYTYDRRGLLLSVAQSSPAGGTNAPPATQVQRLYDGYSQLYDEQVYLGGGIFSHLGQTWDAAGRRATMGRGGLVAAQGSGAGAARSFGYRADGMLTGLGWVGAGGTAQSAAYGFLDNGLPDTRTGPWRSWSVAQRDGRDRPTIEVTDTGLSGWGEPMRELLSWRADSTLSYYNAIRNLGPALGGSNWTEARPYTYDTRGHLLTEGFAPAAGQQAAFNYAFDFGATPGDLGRRTLAMANGWQSLAVSQVDAFGRISQEGRALQSTTITAQGSAPLAGKISLSLDGVAMAPASVTFNAATGVWSAPLTLTAGGSVHTLGVTAAADAYALQPTAVGTATSTFTVGTAGGAGSDSLGRGYDGAGNVLSRGLGAGAGAGTQTLTWDAVNRLTNVQARDSGNAGYNWQAIYDGLGRRLRTVYVPVTSGGVVQTAQTTTTDSWFDPRVEFMEVAVSQNAGVRQWLLYGPDLDGRYGSAQGTGGLEGSVRESDGTGTGYVLDHFGHVEARIEGTTLTWQANRFGGYGALPGGGVVPSYLGANTLAQSMGWQGRRLDPTGLYWLGARHYDPIDGRFLSADPLGHSASADLYAYANGDPVNYLDPDGRFGKDAASQIHQMGLRFSDGLYEKAMEGSDMIGYSAAALAGYGDDWNDGNSQLFHDLGEHPEAYNATQLQNNIAAGTVVSELNTMSLGMVGIGMGFTNALQTGNYNNFQDASLGALLLSSGLRDDPLVGNGDGPVVGLDRPTMSPGLASNIQGRTGELRAQAEIEANGGTVLGEHITLDTSAGRTVPDIYALDANGSPEFVEVKSGPTADLNKNQEANFPIIRSVGAVPAGANAEAAGLTPGVPIGPTPVRVIYYPDIPRPTAPIKVGGPQSLLGVNSGG